MPVPTVRRGTVTPTAVVDHLRAAGCVFAEEEAALLVAAAHSEGELAALVGRRVAGEPLELVLGWAEFCGDRVLVAPGVFVPRRRTAHLVARALEVLPPGGVLVDLCCGTGAVAAAVLRAAPGTTAYAADVDPAAVACARRNVEPLGGTVLEGDLYAALPDALRGRVDVLVANAPYVPTDEIALMPPEARLHEHRVALDGGGDGLDVHRRLVAGATGWLARGGHLLVESSAGQAETMGGLLRAAGLVAGESHDPGLGATVVQGRADRDVIGAPREPGRD